MCYQLVRENVPWSICEAGAAPLATPQAPMLAPAANNAAHVAEAMSALVNVFLVDIDFLL